MTSPWLDQVPPDAHWIITGGTRRGKSGLLELLSRSIIKRSVDGLTAIDPHGGFVRSVFAHVGNPANGATHRVVHFLDPSSPHAFGLNPLQPHDDSWEACHDAAVVLASVVESHFDAAPEQTPRLARLLYVAGVLCARKKLTCLEMLEILSLGGAELRRSLLEDFDNKVVRRELEDLHLLAERHPRDFLTLIESLKNRLVRWLGDKRLARILGSKRGLDLRKIMDDREIVLADFSALTYPDAAFLGTIFTSMFFATARRRPPLQCARHRLILDEAESLITADVARAVDQSAKYGLSIVCSLQRLGQVKEKGPFVLDALMTNCAVKVVFGGLESESAAYLADEFFATHIDYEQYKPNSKRPTAVGQKKETTHSWSRSEMQTDHESIAETVSHTSARGKGSAEAVMQGSAAASASGQNQSQFLTMSNDILAPPAVVGMASGVSNARSSGINAGTSRATSDIEMEGEGRALAIGRGHSRGSSTTEGFSECFVTEYQLLETQMYSLEEQRYRLAGELASLPRRECFVKIEDERPFRTRTATLTPNFKSLFFQRLMLPLFLKSTTERSPYLQPASEVDAAIAARMAAILEKPREPEPDFAASEPMPRSPEPFIHAPTTYAREFWKRNGSTKRKPARRKRSESSESQAANFRVIDGGRDGDNGK